MKFQIAVFSTLVLLSLAGPPMAHGQELITNGTFDAGLEGWTTLSSGPLEWDPTGGNPGGVLRLTESTNAVPVDCFPVIPADLTWSADVFRAAASGCVLTMAWFFTDDCTGSVLEPGDFVGSKETNTWERVTLSLQQLTPQDATTFKPVLVNQTFNAGACYFDNVSFVQNVTLPPQVTEVPTLGIVGLLSLGGLVLVAGLLFIRFRLSSTTKILICLALVSLALGPRIVSAQVVGTWTFDSDLEGWQDNGGPAIIVGRWTETEGNPPGALYALGVAMFPTPDCFEATGAFTLSADVMRPVADAGHACIIAFEAFTNDDCSGYYDAWLGTVLSRPGPEWERLATTVVMPPEFGSYRPLMVGGDPFEGSPCVFDNISIGHASPTEVPTLGTVGLLSLGGLVLVAGLLFIRFRISS